MAKEKKNKKIFLGAFVEPHLKTELERISKAEKRSLNAQVAIFLEWGVTHLKQKQAA